MYRHQHRWNIQLASINPLSAAINEPLVEMLRGKCFKSRRGYPFFLTKMKVIGNVNMPQECSTLLYPMIGKGRGISKSLTPMTSAIRRHVTKSLRAWTVVGGKKSLGLAPF
jgi:hypothetical protein